MYTDKFASALTNVSLEVALLKCDRIKGYLCGDILDFFAECVSHKSDDGEDDKTGEDGGSGSHARDQIRVA